MIYVSIQINNTGFCYFWLEEEDKHYEFLVDYVLGLHLDVLFFFYKLLNGSKLTYF